MENQNIKNAEVLNDLIEINNDRIQGYMKAIEHLDPVEDSDLGSLFEKNVQQSQQFKSELMLHVIREGKQPTDSTFISGKLFRMWIDIKTLLVGEDRKSILAFCESGEDAFKKVYACAWKESTNLPTNVLAIIRSQADLQIDAHDKIKALRDESE